MTTPTSPPADVGGAGLRAKHGARRVDAEMLGLERQADDFESDAETYTRRAAACLMRHDREAYTTRADACRKRAAFLRDLAALLAPPPPSDRGER